MAAKQSNSGYSMARPLAFDYPQDEAVLDLKDEYMFGDYLVCPITQPLSETTVRKVYLPEGKWFDYWNSKVYDGGQTIEVPSTIKRIPLFVRSGSIIPTTEVAEYAGAQIGKPVTINVYPGNDATFTLYEDECDNYNYEKGQFSTIDIKWNDKKNTLTIGECNGSFSGMVSERTFWIKTPKGLKRINYKGKKKTVKL